MAKKPTRATPGQKQADMVRLMGMPEFRRFLFDVGDVSGMWTATATGSEERSLVNETRRNLGMELFQWVEDAIGASPGGPALATLTAVLLEAAKPQSHQGAENDLQESADEFDRTGI